MKKLLWLVAATSVITPIAAVTATGNVKYYLSDHTFYLFIKLVGYKACTILFK